MSTPARPSLEPAAVPLAALLLVLPFEPRRPVWPLLGTQLTLLEAAAGAAMACLALLVRAEMPALLRRPPAPALALALLALVHLASAATAPAYPGLAFVSALRLAAAAALALLVAATPRPALRRAAPALVLGTLLAALLVILEAGGLRALDPFLDQFRLSAFWTPAGRRASGASENPNLTAGFLGYGLMVATALAARTSARLSAGLSAAVLGAGLLLTGSRGGLLAAAGGLVVLAVALRARRRLVWGAVAALLAVVGAATLLVPWFSARMGVEREAAGYRASYEVEAGPRRVEPGESLAVSVRVTNTGRATWPAGRTVFANCGWYAERRYTRTGCEVPLPREVRPGAAVELAAAVRAPREAGAYVLLWDMVSPFGAFSRHGVPPGVQDVRVGAEAEGAAPRPEALVSSRSRLEMWRIALAMGAARPLLGFGPDNYRRLHARFAGWPLEDLASGAHNTFLEMLANTGVPGFLLLLAALGTAARTAWSVAREGGEDAPAAATLAALLACFALHGLVESLLAFTGHYLFLACLLGAAAALTSPSARA